MTIREFTYRGKTLDELKDIEIKEFIQLLPARQRRSLKRGFTDAQKRLLKRLEKKGSNVKTHCRDMIILPGMINKNILVHDGKKFNAVNIQPEMIGHALGEFALTRIKVKHSAPGIGATRSSAAVSVK